MALQSSVDVIYKKKKRLFQSVHILSFDDTKRNKIRQF